MTNHIKKINLNTKIEKNVLINYIIVISHNHLSMRNFLYYFSGKLPFLDVLKYMSGIVYKRIDLPIWLSIQNSPKTLSNNKKRGSHTWSFVFLSHLPLPNKIQTIIYQNKNNFTIFSHFFYFQANYLMI